MYLKTEIYGLAYNCPAGIRLPECPLSGIQNLSYKERIDWIDKLDYPEWIKILEFHSECSLKRK